MPPTLTDIYARQPVLPCNFLSSQVLLHSKWVVRASFDRCVIHDDDALASRDAANSRDDTCARDRLGIYVMSGQLRKLEEGGLRVE